MVVGARESTLTYNSVTVIVSVKKTFFLNVENVLLDTCFLCLFISDFKEIIS